ncbi:chorismate synthase [Candidatus Formimonas warabiya]|uniref:Chorismate synthase n=1 Tax=Formimonas warabiya TaxID=1761012 RepID=A0A3G1KNG4_FORW1|nr:chorismate synthase [Candidatus Formimonas warabiya]ATW24003.1 chorismate synthase [Candidatus Formimonas warabiya]
MRYLTAGESHGPALTAVIEGIPANLPLAPDLINGELARRQMGYGRGGRMLIEKDQVEILSGIRNGSTLGSPITLQIRNRDWINWEKIMSPLSGAEIEIKKITRPRPGHADLSGSIKYQQGDMRNILERSSARETAARVAVGAIAKGLLREIGVFVWGHVVALGNVQTGKTIPDGEPSEFFNQVEKSPVRCGDPETSHKMMFAIDQAKATGDTLGGIFEIMIAGIPIGLGSHVHWDRKLDGRLACALMSIQGIKGVEIGLGFQSARLPGSQVHDEIGYSQAKGLYRMTNRAGGIEGGMSNGEPIVLRGAMKPIPTLIKPLNTVDMENKCPVQAQVERSDVCAVPAASVIGEAVTAWEIAQLVLEKFGGDTMAELKERMEEYRKYVKQV